MISSERPADNSSKETLAQTSHLLSVFVEMQFSGGWVRAWSGYGEQALRGELYTGVGSLGEISGFTEDGGITAQNIIVGLNGVPEEQFALVLREKSRNRPANVYLVLFNQNGIVGSGLVAFQGRMDIPLIDDGRNSGKVSISVESKMLDFRRPRIRRYTHEDQIARYPGDLGLIYVPSLQNKPLPWGKDIDNSRGAPEQSSRNNSSSGSARPGRARPRSRR